MLYKYLHSVIVLCVAMALSDGASSAYYPINMQDNCGRTHYIANDTKNYGYVLLSRYLNYYKAPDECSIRLVAKTGEKLLFRIREIDIFYSPGCETEYLQFDGHPPICGTFKNYNVDHLAESGTLVLYFNSTRDYFNSSDYRYKGFTVTYTSYTDSGSCDKFYCSNGRCIPHELRCDDVVNCGECLSDEEKCSLAADVIAIIIFVTVLLTLLSGVGFLYCYCRYQKDQKKLERNMRNITSSQMPTEVSPQMMTGIAEYSNPAYNTPHTGEKVTTPPTYGHSLNDPSEPSLAGATGGADVVESKM